MDTNLKEKERRIELIKRYTPTMALVCSAAMIRAKHIDLERDTAILTAAYAMLDNIEEKLRYEILEDYLDLNF